MASALHTSHPDTQDFNCFEAPTSSPRVISYNKFITKLSDYLVRIGIDPMLYAEHFFRSGGASFANQTGVLIDPITALGD